MAALTYKAALEALADPLTRFGIGSDWGAREALLRELGDPQRSLRGALVAGTNGKGSVPSRALVEAAGYRVATTPKPHLVSYRERLQIDGRPVDPVTFARHGRGDPPSRRPGGSSARRPDRVRAAHRGCLPLVRGGASRRRARRSRTRRPARCDTRMGRRGRGDHQRRARSYGAARADGRGDCPRKRPRSSNAAMSR